MFAHTDDFVMINPKEISDEFIHTENCGVFTHKEDCETFIHTEHSGMCLITQKIVSWVHKGLWNVFPGTEDSVIILQTEDFFSYWSVIICFIQYFIFFTLPKASIYFFNNIFL